MRSDEAGPRRAALHLVEAGGEARHVALDRPVLHIGRAQASCGLVLAGPEIAAHHCCLRQVGGRWWLFDRGAAAGTFINSERCREPTVLRDGDRISIGLHVLEFRSAPALDLAQVLERLGGEAIALDFTTPTGSQRPTSRKSCRAGALDFTGPPAPRRPRPTLGTIGLAAAAGFAVTLSIAADFAPENAPLASGRSVSIFDSTPESVSSGVTLSIADIPESPAEPVSSDMSRSHTAFAPVTPRAAVPSDRSRSRSDLAPHMARASVSSDISLIKVEGTQLPPSAGTGAGSTEYLVEPGFELPADALARGRPDAGSLVHALQLPPSPDYTIRCPAHAYASSVTVAELMHALAGFRNRSSYRGELIVGDLSRADGGRYGPHRSHQSGRDVDLWLPVKGGSYRRGCAHCGTDLCRPEPDEVDWQATWELVAALSARGRVEDVFLAWDLQPALHEAARRLGAPETTLARQIQHPVRGRAALVKHADGHTHHLHVRFRCPAGDTGCVAM